MSKPLTAVLGLTTCVFAGLYITKAPSVPTDEENKSINIDVSNSEEIQKKMDELNKRLKKKDGQIEDLKTKLNSSQNEVSKLLRDKAQMMAELDALKKKNPELAKKIDEDKKEDEGESDRRAQMRERMKAMMNNENMQKMWKDRTVEGIKRSYGRLFKKLNLSEDEQKELTDMMAARSMKRYEMWGKMRVAENDEEREEVRKSIEDERTKLGDDIKDLLGDKYKDYEMYNNTRRERESVSRLSRNLTGDNALSEDGQEELVSSIYETKNNFKYSVDVNWDDREAVSKMTDDEVKTYLTERKELNKKIVENSNLNEDQKKELEKNLQRDTSRAEMYLNFRNARGGWGRRGGSRRR